MIFDDIPYIENNNQKPSLSFEYQINQLKDEFDFATTNKKLQLDFDDNDSDNQINLDSCPYGKYSQAHNTFEWIWSNRKIFNSKISIMDLTNSTKSRTLSTSNLISLSKKYFKKALLKTKRVINLS